MNNSPRFKGPVLSHQLISVSGSLSRVYHKRKLRFLCHLDLSRKPLLLNLSVRIVLPVIIKPDLAHCDNLSSPGKGIVPDQRYQGGKILPIQLRRAGWMHTKRRINKGVGTAKLQSGLAAFQIRRNIYNPADAILLHAGKQLLPILVKGLVIIMRMRLKNHCLSPF